MITAFMIAAHALTVVFEDRGNPADVSGAGIAGDKVLDHLLREKRRQVRVIEQACPARSSDRRWGPALLRPELSRRENPSPPSSGGLGNSASAEGLRHIRGRHRCSNSTTRFRCYCPEHSN